MHCARVLHRPCRTVWNSLPSVQRCHSTHVHLHLGSLLLVHLPGSLWKSLIALLYAAPCLWNELPSSRASSDTVSFTFTYHTWQFTIFSIFTITTWIFSILVHSFVLNLRLGSLANPFHHRPFLTYRTDSTDSRAI